MDDQDIIRQCIPDMLGEIGFSVETAADGKEAIEIYCEAFGSENQFDVLILDLTIPGGIGGKEALEDILKIDPEATAIVSSGYAKDPIIANYADYGFKGIAVKPYTKENLLIELGKVIKSN